MRYVRSVGSNASREAGHDLRIITALTKGNPQIY